MAMCARLSTIRTELDALIDLKFLHNPNGTLSTPELIAKALEIEKQLNQC